MWISSFHGQRVLVRRYLSQLMRFRHLRLSAVMKYSLILSLLIYSAFYIYRNYRTSTPYARCRHRSYIYSVSDHGFRAQAPDRSNRISHLLALESFAVKIEESYIKRLSLGYHRGHPNCMPIPIIYDCSSSFQECGGLGDRLKGLASTFYLALLTNSRFYYHWTFPAALSNYFVAANSSLSSSVETARSLMGIKYLTMFEWWCMNWHCMVRDVERTKTGNLPELWQGYSSVISHTNMAYWDLLVRNPYLAATARQYGLHLLRQDEMFYVFTKLYFTRLSSSMGQAIEPFNRIMASNSTVYKVGVQLRIGNDTPWHEGPRHHLSAVGCFVERAKLKCEQEAHNGKDCVVFVTTDSPKALSLFEERFRFFGISMLATNGTISHLDKPGRSWIGLNLADQRTVITENSRVFMDWFLLTKMDYLYISRSGFAETAAFAGMVPAERSTTYDESWCSFSPWTGHAGAKLW